MKQDEFNLLETDIDDKPFASRLAAIRYTLAYYRISNECIEHVFKHYSADEVACAVEALGNPLEYVAEPDHRLLEWLKVITHRYTPMPAFMPNDHKKKIIKTDVWLAARNLVKIRDMMKTMGIIVNKTG